MLPISSPCQSGYRNRHRDPLYLFRGYTLLSNSLLSKAKKPERKQLGMLTLILGNKCPEAFTEGFLSVFMPKNSNANTPLRVCANVFSETDIHRK